MLYRRLPVIKRFEPVSTRRVKSSTKILPAGVTTCNNFKLETWRYIAHKSEYDTPTSVLLP